LDRGVNVVTGGFGVGRIVLGQDAGRVLNPLDFCGQMEGAALMELGAALMEEHVPTQTLSFRRYPMPRTRDLPEIEVLPVEVAGRDGPYGAKGIGEMGTGHVRAAIVNALCDATGVRLRRLPATPERVLAALARRDEGEGRHDVL
jgi:CO/xanthine dehydrogenase Mo-binding subunit